MGSYLFSDQTDCLVTCDNDINTLKYVSTKSKELKFNIKEENFSTQIIEFFKYLHQKFKFTNQLNIIRMTVRGNIIDEENLEIFLGLQKHINKYALYKKNCTTNKNIAESSTFQIKIEYDDAIYLVKHISPKNNSTKQLNYFGIFSFSKNYSNKHIIDFLLNENQSEYDHLLPSFIQNKHISSVIEFLSQYLELHCVDNIKLPPLIVQENNSDFLIELKIFLNRPEHKFRVRLKVLDLSFVIFASNLCEISTKIKHISGSFKINSSRGSDYIYRFYLFTKFNNSSNLEEIMKMFAKGISLLTPKINSYVILYLFIPKYIKLNTSYVNPGYSDSIQDKITKDIDLDHQRKRKHETWKNRNSDESYVPQIKSAILTKNLLKIYTSTNFNLWSLIYSTYGKDSQIKALKKKSILSVITKFISIRFNIKKYNDQTDPKVKNIVNLAYIQSLVEYQTSYVMYPKDEIELHQDLVYIHYDQIFRILRYSDEN